jgi:phage anti-repressor protein
MTLDDRLEGKHLYDCYFLCKGKSWKMSKQYHIDLEKYPLQKFKRNLESREMIPSRVCLKDQLDERFEILQANGITNLKELTDRLKTKTKIEEYSAETGLPVEYLTILNREAKSYHPNPVRLDKFAGIPAETIQSLAAEGIKNTRQLFNWGKSKSDRERLAQRTAIPIESIEELVCLSDLTRTYGVGPVFARMIYDVGIQTIQDFVAINAQEFIWIYEREEGKKADFGVQDIQFSLEMARDLDIAIEI